MISIENLSFSYGNNVVLKNVTMSLEEGHIYGLLGENGVGKTTLLTLLSGLKKAKVGTIDIDGKVPFDRQPSLLSEIYYLCDEVAEANMTAIDYAQTYGKLWVNFDLEKFIKVMEELENDTNKKMNQMSFGQLKKTHIAFAIACNTKYLFMDEPTNGLDIPSKSQFRKTLTKFIRTDATLLISTHQVRDLESIIDPIIILDKQQVLLNASVKEISEKLYFDYENELKIGALYSEMIPGGCIQVMMNTNGEDSKVNIEALFNTVYKHKELMKNLFTK